MIDDATPSVPRDPAEQGRRIDGRWVLLTLAVLAALVPFMVWRTLRWVEARHAAAPPLQWSQRGDWPHIPVRSSTLQATGIGRLLGGGDWRNIPFHLTEPEEASVLALRELAMAPDFAADEVRRSIEAQLEQQPDSFYGHYLLATWHRLHGHADAARAHYNRAFALAPVVLRQPYVTPDGDPAAGLELGAIELECNRIEFGQLDTSLTLVYPELVTDQQGEVFLPAYRTVYRLTARPHPTGYDADYPELKWFEAPAQVATLPPVVVRPLD